MEDIILNRLKLLRTQKGVTQAVIAHYIGISQNNYSYWENGKVKIDADSLRRLAEYFNVTVDYILGLDEKHPRTLNDEVELNDLYPIPLLGRVVAGVPLEAQENLEGYIYISYRPTEEYFALRVKGQSMKNAGIFDKSIVVCHKQETADNGEIVVAMLNGEQTVKRLKFIGDSLFLWPENPDFEPIQVKSSDELLILGKVVEVRMTL